MFKTDLNDRERKRIAQTCRELARVANECAEALEQADDMKLMVSFLLLNITCLGLTELNSAITESITKEQHATAGSDDEFPSVIGE